MRLTSSLACLSLAAPLVSPILAAPAFQVEAGASYFALRHTRFDSGSTVFSVDEPSKVAPFLATSFDFTERLGLRLSYHYLNNVHTTVQFGSPPGTMLPVVVWGHYEDDVHLLSAAPGFKWTLAPSATIAIEPELNWVASRGVVSFSTTNPAVLLVGPRRRNDDGFTLGGSVRFLWALGNRSAVTVGYQYVDLDPSFDREAHVFSGGVQWKF